MKKPYKKPFVAFTILALVMFAAFVALFILHPLLKFGDALAVLTNVYFNPATYQSLFAFDFSNLGNIFEFVSWCLAALVALFFLVYLFVAIFGIRKKASVKVFVLLLCVFGMAIAYFGITAFYHNIMPVDYVKAAIADYAGLVEYLQLQDYLGFAFLLGLDLAALLFVIFAIAACINGFKYARLADDREVQPDAVEEPVEEPEAEEEPAEELEGLPVFIPEPEEEPIDPQGLSQTALAAIIKDVVREIVRDELERNNLVSNKCEGHHHGPNDSHTENHSVVGATFGGPLIVQYFNGGIQSAVPSPAPAEPVKEQPAEEEEEEPAPAPAEEPVKEEPKPVEEPAPVAEPVEEPKPAEPVVEEQPKTPIIRIPFDERLLSSDKELQDIYNELKNEILSYGVKSRVSSSGDTFRLHRKTYVKITVAGKSLKLYFALNPDDYRDSPIPVQDASEKGIYEEIPLVFKVKSPLSVRRCKQLIQDVMEKDSLEQGEIGSVNWIKEMKAELKARKAEKK